MNIGIDIREACTKNRTGKGQWTYGFVSELLTRSGVSCTFFSDSDHLPDGWPRDRLVLKKPGLLWHLGVSRELKSHNLDCYLSPTSYIVPALGSTVPLISVVHDLIAFRNEPHDKKAQLIERCTLKKSLDNTSVVCAVSHATADDLCTRYPYLDRESIVVLGAGPASVEPAPNNVSSPAIVCIGTLCPRKNQIGLLKAYQSLPDSILAAHPLIFAGGRGWQDEELIREIEATDNVSWEGYIDDSRYEELLSTCFVFALPSFYEGFGMQILDAMQRGCVIVTSDRGSLKEVTGSGAIHVDPDDTDSIRSGLAKALADEDLRSSVSEKAQREAERYSWKNSVDAFLRALNGQ